MWGSGKSDRKRQAGITLIANNCEIVGDVHFTDQLQVNGVVKGNIIADAAGAKLSVSEHGCVEGEIRVPNVVINGEVLGDIHSAKHVELAAKARVRGSVYYNLIEMVLGAEVEGNLHHVTDQEAAQRVTSVATGERGASADGRQAERVAGVAPKVVQPVARG